MSGLDILSLEICLPRPCYVHCMSIEDVVMVKGGDLQPNYSAEEDLLNPHPK